MRRGAGPDKHATRRHDPANGLLQLRPAYRHDDGGSALMDDSIRIRAATEADAASLLAIYRPFVDASAISFETVAPSTDEFATRIRKFGI